jgi:hypothetical protein
MHSHHLTDRDHEELAVRGLRELTTDETALVSGGCHPIGTPPGDPPPPCRVC